MKVSIIVFEINEIDGMRAMMPQIKREWYDELLIVDGGSTDGTIEYAREHGYDLFVQKAKGVGAALNEAVRKAHGDIVVIYAPDGSFLPDRIPMMVQKIKEGCDIVNVTRYGYGARSYDDTLATSFGNWTFTTMANLFFGNLFKFTDFLYTYLGFRRNLVEDLALDTTLMTWGQILLLRGIKRGLKVVEIPGDEHRRVGGAVKVPKLRAAYQLFTTILRERFSEEPSRQVRTL
ncbi:MAG: glycosyltransferase family 2 protein [Armatimonadetes bacterium]|nr:glycosyltransferase family 2 protein [Armatimonadota bacterium]